MRRYHECWPMLWPRCSANLSLTSPRLSPSLARIWARSVRSSPPCFQVLCLPGSHSTSLPLPLLLPTKAHHPLTPVHTAPYPAPPPSTPPRRAVYPPRVAGKVEVPPPAPAVSPRGPSSGRTEQHSVRRSANDRLHLVIRLHHHRRPPSPY